MIESFLANVSFMYLKPISLLKPPINESEYAYAPFPDEPMQRSVSSSKTRQTIELFFNVYPLVAIQSEISSQSSGRCVSSISLFVLRNNLCFCFVRHLLQMCQRNHRSMTYELLIR